MFEVAINTATNATTEMSPAMILLGRHPRMPLQMVAEEVSAHAEETTTGEREMAMEDWVRTLQEDLIKIWELVVTKQRQANERYAANYNTGRKP